MRAEDFGDAVDVLAGDAEVGDGAEASGAYGADQDALIPEDSGQLGGVVGGADVEVDHVGFGRVVVEH